MAFLSLLLLSCIPALLLVNAQQQLEAAQFKAMLEAGSFAAVLDVRSTAEFNQGHIEGATLMNSLASGGSSPTALAGCESCTIAVYCNSGARAAAAISVLQQAGFQGTLYNALGVQQWTAAGFPLVLTGSKTPVCTVELNNCDPGFLPSPEDSEPQPIQPPPQQQQSSSNPWWDNIWNLSFNNGGFNTNPSNSGVIGPENGGQQPSSAPITASQSSGSAGSFSNPWGPRWDTTPDTRPNIGSGENPTIPPPETNFDETPTIPPPQTNFGVSSSNNNTTQATTTTNPTENRPIGRSGNWTWKEGLESGSASSITTMGSLLITIVVGVMMAL